jgi:ribosomal protein S18
MFPLSLSQDSNQTPPKLFENNMEEKGKKKQRNKNKIGESLLNSLDYKDIRVQS